MSRAVTGAKSGRPTMRAGRRWRRPSIASREPMKKPRPGVAATAALVLAQTAVAQPTLSGWALLPANTFSDGPTSGQFAGPGAGTDLVMPDNGFGTQGNSGDTLLRRYGMRPDFRTPSGGTGTVSAVDFG